jgi:hypothetical protein
MSQCTPSTTIIKKKNMLTKIHVYAVYITLYSMYISLYIMLLISINIYYNIIYMNEIIYIIYYVTIVYIMYKYLNNICVSKKHKRPYIFSYLFKQIQNSSAIL